MKLILTGMMGSGKTTVGQLLADKLGLPFLDMDRQIEQENGLSVARIFAQEGESGFRRREKELVRRLADFKGVIASGGGVLLDPENEGMLRQGGGVIIYLQAFLETLKNRLQGDRSRPLLKTGSIDSIYRQRQEIYSQAADMIVSTDNLTPEEVVRKIVSQIRKIQ